MLEVRFLHSSSHSPNLDRLVVQVKAEQDSLVERFLRLFLWHRCHALLYISAIHVHVYV